MPRRAKPWWWEARGRWAATVDGRRVVAPPEIGRGDEHDAWEWHRTMRAEAARPGSAMRVADLCNAWVAWDRRRVAAGDRDGPSQVAARRRLQRACGTVIDGRKLGAIPAREVVAGHLEAALTRWGEDGLSPNYRREVASTLKGVFRWAAKPAADRPALIAASPLDAVKLPPARRSPARVASRAEAAAWLRWLWRRGHREFALLQRCLIHSGARPREVATATWGDVTWHGHRDAAGHWMAIVTRSEWKNARKTGRPRLVYLPARVCRSLRRREGKAAELIWRSPRGLKWSANGLTMMTLRERRAAIAAKVPLLDAGPDRLTNYRWRHTAASSLAVAGVDLPTIADLLGTSVAQLTKTYVHLLSSHLGRAAENLGRK